MFRMVRCCPDCANVAAEVFSAVIADIEAQRTDETQIVSHLRLEPRWEQLPSYVRGSRSASGWLEPRDTLCLDLSQSVDEMMEHMKPKGRYNVRLARRKGVSVVEDISLQGVADFVEMYHETAQRQGALRHSRQYITELSQRLSCHDRGSIFFAEYQGLRLATALVIYFGDTATYKYGGSKLVHRNVMGPYLLHFEALLAAKSRGCRWYDFYGVSPPGQPDNDWANFSAFKRKFGGREIRFVPPLDFVYDEHAYRDYLDGA